MPELPAAVWLPSAHAVPAEILYWAKVPHGEQAGEPTPLAGKAREPGLFLRCAARQSRAGVARETPRMWPRNTDNRPTVTRDDNGL